MRYFVSGHRDLTPDEFEEHYALLIYQIIMEDSFAEFFIGDWEGCDTMVLNYIEDNFVKTKIHLFYVDKPRLQLSQDSENILFTYSRPSYDECDEAMTNNTDFDIAWIRPGKEDSHTAKNIKRRYGF